MTNKETATTANRALAGIKVVVIDDDPVALEAMRRHLEKRGCDVQTAKNGTAGLELIDDSTSVALIDLRMPGIDGLGCLASLAKTHPTTKSIIVTSSNEVHDAVEAMKQGAFQYITKPFDPESLCVQVLKAHDAWQLANENSELRESLTYPDVPSKLETDETDFNANLMANIRRISKFDSTVYIGGESGTGKTTVARMIHQMGPRSSGPFIAINCASLPRDLIESELFGHAKGAFTGAIKERIGKAELANGGTLFLDEIGDLPLELQPKLLTFLQDRVIQRVGCNIVRNVDLRLIVATHRDLPQMCRDNRFRQDLYYRLNVLSVQLPPLRERANEIAGIAKSVVRSICQRQGINELKLSAEAITVMESYPWPGNIRELENVLERSAAFITHDEVLPSDLIFDASADLTAVKALEPTLSKSDDDESSQNVYSLAGRTLEELEIQAIIDTLGSNSGNRAKSARMLGISEKSIYNKMKRLGIVFPAKGKDDQ